MEKLNLYESKVKRIKPKTFLILIAVMLLPGIALRVYLESQWAYSVKLLSIKYQTVLSSSGIKLRGKKNDLAVIEAKRREYDAKSKMIISQRKYLLDFFEKAYLSKKFFDILYRDWRKDDGDWAVMSELSFNLDSFSVEMYEIYSSGEKMLSSDLLPLAFRELFPISNGKILYDVEVFKNMKLRRTVIRGGNTPNK